MAFIDNFIQIRNGGLSIEAEHAQEEAVKAVRETGKKASVIIRLDILPGESGPDPSVMIVKAKVETKLPKLEPKETFFFVDPQNNNLTLNRVDQLDLYEAGVEREDARQ